MSYAIGGVGVNHTDSSALIELMDYLKEQHRTLAPEADRFFALRGINFDYIRANGGVCAHPKKEIAFDLNGIAFGHSNYGANKKYCFGRQGKKATTLEDWQIFRHWIRAALWLRDVQRYIIERWLNKTWIPSYDAVMGAGGSVEEVMINSRIRNSSPYTAKCALDKANQVAAADRIQSQLDAYANIGYQECRGNPKYKERFGVMQRPVVLYRHFR
ncbi:hypothetical protein [Pseudomonas sp. GM17]|uniref:hypothetical protein n=1 Tax=Pseudomonas sp. GM17 TaxID=1144323 RepID=UPI00027255CC|nr:hypothetical protein [Pseudomonas sp. GM17]WIE48643.1 hypothetical protein PMI20_023260 [Pseudomonas sp. GM17]